MKVYKLEQEDNVIARNQTVSIGLDVHARNTEVVVVGPREVLHRQSIPTEREHFLALGARFENCDARAVYEASSVGYKPLRWLREAGLEAYMTPPALIPKRQGEYVKTDRRDAVKLAEYDRGNLLDPVWDLSDVQYDDRQLVRSRKQLVEHRTRICQQIKSMLQLHGIQAPEGVSTNWSKAYLEWLASEPAGRPGIDASLGAMVRIRQELTEEIGGLSAKIEALAKTERYRRPARLLKSAPGVGTITAMTYLVELGDVVERFDSCEKLSSFLGLAPSESSSGDKKRKGGLPKAGNKWVRTALIQASWQLIGKDDELREVYDRIKAKNPQHGAGIGIVAVARRLGIAMRAMLRDGVGWRGEVIEAEDADEQVSSDETSANG